VQGRTNRGKRGNRAKERCERKGMGLGLKERKGETGDCGSTGGDEWDTTNEGEGKLVSRVDVHT